MRRIALATAVLLIAGSIVGIARIPSAAAGIVLLGDTAVARQVDSNSPGAAQAYGYRATASGLASSITLYVDSTSTATQIQVGLYTNASEAPSTVLATASFFSPGSGWQTASIPVTGVISGTTYWLGILQPAGSGGTVEYRDENGSGAPAPMSTSGSLAELPSVWSSGVWWPAGPASIYVSGNASSTSSPTPTASPTPTPASTLTPTPTPTTTATPTPTPAPSRLTFEDEFSGTSVNPGFWDVLNHPGDVTNNEQGCYVQQDVAVSGGVMALTSKSDSSCDGYSFTSGAVQCVAGQQHGTT